MQVDYSPAPPVARHGRLYKAVWIAWIAVPAFGLLSGVAFLWVAGVPISTVNLRAYLIALVYYPMLCPFTFSASIAGILVAGAALWPLRWPRSVRLVLPFLLPFLALLLTATLTLSVMRDWPFMAGGELLVPRDQPKEDRLARQNDLSIIWQDLREYARDTYGTHHQRKYPPTFKSFQVEMYDAQHPGILDRFQMKGISFDQKVASFDDPTCPYGLFVYVGGYLTEDSPGSSVVMYERLKPNSDGICVLHLDGTVLWLNKDAAKQLIASFANYKPPATQP